MASASRPDAAIDLVPYDPSWPVRFAGERTFLQRLLQEWLVGPIEHVGSTAVPGLAAKPVIDLMAPVATLQASLGAIAAATAGGYVHYPYKPEVMHWFCKPSPSRRTHHLHLVPFGSTTWVQTLAFRDALRREPEVAARYAHLKQELAARFKYDREAYTEGKLPFIQSVLGNAA
jgi:GrpB-like predicted nucleotidyltransferase (UPF0157 family)